ARGADADDRCGEGEMGADREGAQPEDGVTVARMRRQRVAFDAVTPKSGTSPRVPRISGAHPGYSTYAGRRASDNQTPPPISAAPERRPSSLARHVVMNHARPSPAATAQAESVQAASTTDTAHITASWRSAGRLGSMNCGRNAVKKAIVFGFESATA